jgi:hypothetical protein
MSYKKTNSNDYLYSTTRPVTAYPFTISIWFKTPGVTNNQVLGAIDIPIASGYKILGTLEASGGVGSDPLRAYTYNGSSFGIAVTSSGFSANTWTHACGVFTSTTSRDAYIDGGSKGSDTTSIVGDSSDFVLTRRRRNAAVGDMDSNSFIAEVAVWDVALSEANIASLAGGTAASSVDSGNLIAYWPLTTVTTNEDQVGSNDLTENGFLYDADHPTISGTTYVELAGTIAAQSAMSGDLSIPVFSELAGTIAAQSAMSGNLGFSLVNMSDAVATRRIVAVGNNQVWYEDA